MRAHSKVFQTILSIGFVVLPALASAQTEETTALPPPPPAPPALAPTAPAAPHAPAARAGSHAIPVPAMPPIPYDSALVIELLGDEPMTITAYSLAEGADRNRALFTCRTPCRVRMYPGKYRFHVRGGKGKIEAARVVELGTSEALRFSLPTREEKSGALATAITGTALAPIGLMIAWVSAWSASCFDCQGDERQERETPAGVYVGLGMFVAGAILTPVGWVAFARNRKPRLQETPLVTAPGSFSPRQTRRVSPNQPPQIGFGVTPVRGGANAGVWGRF